MVSFRWSLRDMSERRLESMHCLRMRVVGDEDLVLILQWFGGFDIYNGLDVLVNLDSLVAPNGLDLCSYLEVFNGLEVLDGLEVFDNGLKVYDQLLPNGLADRWVELLEL